MSKHVARVAWNHTGEWADLMASYMLGVGIVPQELLPDADCENCEHKLYAQGGHCYVFLQRPGDKCAQFKARKQDK